MLSIRKISANDDLINIVLEIQKASWVAASEISPDDYSIQDLRAFLLSSDSVFIVAYSDEQFAGMASAKILNKPNGDIWLYIDEVDVCQNHQKKGIGKELMNYLFRFAQESNCDEIRLGTEVKNKPANALYKSLKPSEIQTFIGYTYTIE